MLVGLARICSSYSRRSSRRERPKSSKKKKNDKKDQLVVALYENGDLALNANVLEKRDLHEQLRKRLLAKEKKVVFVDAHPNLAYGDVITLMDLVKSAGADRVDPVLILVLFAIQTHRVCP